MYAMNISLTGSRHRQANQDCQDYSKTMHLEAGGHKILIAVACDGVGSAAYSKKGAKTAANTYLKLIRQGLLKEDFSHRKGKMLDLLHTAMRGARAAVDALADSEGNPRREYDTCLTGAVLRGDGRLFWSQAGDGGLVALGQYDGTYRKLTPRCNGEEAGSVFPLSCDSQWVIGSAEEIASVMMCTDGVLDHFVAAEALGSLVYWPFLAPAFRPINSKKEVLALKQQWMDFLTGKIGYNFPARVTDDLTVVILGLDGDCIRQALERVSWNEETFLKQLKEARQRVWPNLYPAEATET